MAELYALIAAILFGLGTALMQRGTLQTSQGAGDIHFYLAIFKRPAWLLGGLATLGGGLLQLVALGSGDLIVVQPILTLSLVFALPFGVLFSDQHVGRREIVASLMVIAGLALFLIIAQPQGGVDQPSARAWLLSTAAVTALVAVAVLSSPRRAAAQRAGLLGAAAGVCFGYEAAVMKEFTTYVGYGVAALLSTWSTYAVIVGALAGGALQQASLKVGVLPPAMSAVNVANLLISVAMGLVVFQETIAHGGGRVALSLGCLGVTVVGVAALVRARSDPRQSGTQRP